jgi:DNA-binding transcriptional LysR family regulator
MGRGGVEIRQLAYFAAVAEELSFARAAQRLHIVQPAVSQQVRRLERALRVQLFDRGSRHVRLTAAGERLLPEARSILSAVQRTRQVAAEIADGTDGMLRREPARAWASGSTTSCLSWHDRLPRCRCG